VSFYILRIYTCLAVLSLYIDANVCSLLSFYTLDLILGDSGSKYPMLLDTGSSDLVSPNSASISLPHSFFVRVVLIYVLHHALINTVGCFKRLFRLSRIPRALFPWRFLHVHLHLSNLFQQLSLWLCLRFYLLGTSYSWIIYYSPSSTRGRHHSGK
jgi:hypothetical protein